MEYETVIGLEVHVHLKTKTKAFCGCLTEFGSEPNTQTCPVCLGFPGSLPVLNEKALEYAVKVAIALNCKVQEFIKFDRKNYFYPDLPKNYQISQYDMPIGLNGFLDISMDSGEKKIHIKRVHLEEDAAKLIHKQDGSVSLVDYNRCGIALLEIVSEPDISSPLEAFEYLKSLKLIIQYLGVSDCDMEKGSLRCDANISLRLKGEKQLGTKIELKNMNSFKGVRSALEYEVNRQSELLSQGRKIIQETRLWDEDRQLTFSMRSKEEAHDYRYFPDPDLVPFVFTKEYIEDLKEQLPELPQMKLERFQREYKLKLKEAQLLVDNKDLCLLFEESLRLYPQPKKLFNWLSGAVLAYANEKNKSITDLGLKPEELIKLIKYVQNGILINMAAKHVLNIVIDEKKSIDTIIKEKGLTQVSDEERLNELVNKIIRENPNSVKDFLSGKENAIMFLVGQTMKLSQGRANPKVVKELLARRLNESKT